LHQKKNSPLLQPEDCSERAAKENALHTSEGDDSLWEGAVTVHPLEGPVCLLLYTGQGLNSVEQVVFFSSILPSLGVSIGTFHSKYHFILQVGDLRFYETKGKNEQARKFRGFKLLSSPFSTTKLIPGNKKVHQTPVRTLMYMSISKLYISEWTFSIATWKP
jgi:hypothetical protein